MAIKKSNDETIAKVNGFKSVASMKLCHAAMEKCNIVMVIDRHNFIQGWQAHEKMLKEKINE